MTKLWTRREFTVLGGMAAAGHALGAGCSEQGLKTPYKIGKLVLSASYEKGAYDSLSVDCPFVFSHEGKFYMTFVAFDGIGYQTGLASSHDLLSWTKEGCILKRDPSVPYLKYNVAMNWIVRKNDLASSGRLKKIGGDYLGAYHAYPSEGLEQGAAVIGLARSKDLRSWTVDLPVLRPQDAALWERGGLYKPCLLEYQGTYHLFYNAKNRTTGPWHEQTGTASSEDLKLWKRFSGNPIIANGGPGSPDERFASDPCVLRNGAEWAFFYFGLDAKGVARDLVATGTALTKTVKCPEALVDISPPGSVDSKYAHKPSLISYKGDLYHFYCAVSIVNGREIRGISVARSRPW